MIEDEILTIFLAATLMFIDMYWRLYSRVSAGEVLKKNQ